MAEGPVNFGKPLLILVIAGCAGAGYWAWKNWPTHYEGPGWEIDFPNKWDVTLTNDPAVPGKVIASGPLKMEEWGTGVGWVSLTFHGTIDFKAFVAEKVNTTLEKIDDSIEINQKRSFLFEYEEQEAGYRYLGSAVDRVDAVVISVIGCKKAFFEDNRAAFEKVVKSVKCSR
jgi:hypothetical protein